MRLRLPALFAAVLLPLTGQALSLTQTILPGKLPASMTRLGGPAWSLQSALQPLNHDRYVLVGTPGYQWEKGARRPEAIGWPILDLVSRKVDLVTMPGSEDYKPGCDLVHYDPARQSAGMVVQHREGDTRQIRFAHWDLAANRIDWTETMAEATKRNLYHPIGMDPEGKAFYFMLEQHPSRNLSYEQHATEALLKRFDLASRTVDWEVTLKLPGRTSHMIGSLHTAASPDFTKLAVLEYSEPGYGKLPPPQGWVVDVAGKGVTTIPVPMTPYGVAFDRQGRYLAIGSNAEARICRYDLKAGKRDMVVPSLSRLHRLALGADNKTLLVFGKGRELEQRSWPNLHLVKRVGAGSLIKGQQWFDPEGMAVMGNGRTLVLHQTMPPYGFKSDKALYQVSL